MMSKTWRYKLVVEFQATDFPAAAHFLDTLTDCMDVNMGVTVAELEKLDDPVTSDDVILACAAEGLDIEVVETGGGYLHFRYLDDKTQVLLGEVGRDGSFDLGICPSVKFWSEDFAMWGWQYDDALDRRVQEAFPFSAYPDEEDARACASWMQRVVAWLLDDVDPITGGE